jgi:hypothetical protein
MVQNHFKIQDIPIKMIDKWYQIQLKYRIIQQIETAVLYIYQTQKPSPHAVNAIFRTNFGLFLLYIF